MDDEDVQDEKQENATKKRNSVMKMMDKVKVGKINNTKVEMHDKNMFLATISLN